MLEALRENAIGLNAPTHKRAAEQLVIDTERTLLAENIEWANIAKYQATT
jgi:hypothetical protein